MKISKKLIEKKGFSFIAVEGDWPDCYKLNRYVKN
jgi:erythromycin esterase-like protein